MQIRLALVLSMALDVDAVRRVLVTGANKGIGRAICAKLLSEYDDTFVLLGSRSSARGDAAREAILAENTKLKPERIEVLELDVTSDESVSAAAGHVAERFVRATIRTASATRSSRQCLTCARARRRAGFGWATVRPVQQRGDRVRPRRADHARDKSVRLEARE